MSARDDVVVVLEREEAEALPSLVRVGANEIRRRTEDAPDGPLIEERTRKAEVGEKLWRRLSQALRDGAPGG